MSSLSSLPAWETRPARAWAVGLGSSLNLKTLPYHADQVLIAATVYQALFDYVAPAVSRAIAPDTYNKLSKATQINWNSRVVGFVQAVFISTKALQVIFTDPSRTNTNLTQRLWGYSGPTGTVQAYAAGYFLWDIYISTRYVDIFGPSTAIHGLAALLVTMLGFRPFANYYGVNFVLYELSTPFLNVHWILDKVGMTGSTTQLVNGLALVGSFFGCRLVWGTYQTWLLGNDMYQAWQQGPVPKLLFGTYLLANTTLTCLNFYWFGKMLEALKKRFEPKDKKRA